MPKKRLEVEQIATNLRRVRCCRLSVGAGRRPAKVAGLTEEAPDASPMIRVTDQLQCMQVVFDELIIFAVASSKSLINIVMTDAGLGKGVGLGFLE